MFANTVGHRIEAICDAHGVGTDEDGALPNIADLYMDPSAGIEFTIHLSIRKGRVGEPKLGLYDGYPELPLNVRSFMGVDCTVPLGMKNKVMKRVVTQPEIEARVDGIWNEVFS